MLRVPGAIIIIRGCVVEPARHAVCLGLPLNHLRHFYHHRAICSSALYLALVLAMPLFRRSSSDRWWPPPVQIEVGSPRQSDAAQQELERLRGQASALTDRGSEAIAQALAGPRAAWQQLQLGLGPFTCHRPQTSLLKSPSALRGSAPVRNSEAAETVSVPASGAPSYLKGARIKSSPAKFEQRFRQNRNPAEYR